MKVFKRYDADRLLSLTINISKICSVSLSLEIDYADESREPYVLIVYGFSNDFVYFEDKQEAQEFYDELVKQLEDL